MPISANVLKTYLYLSFSCTGVEVNSPHTFLVIFFLARAV